MHRPEELTDNEGAFLALIMRNEPVTAYQIAKRYDASPIYTFNTAKGKLYPLLHRLAGRGLLSTTSIEDDARGTQLYRCTERGRNALQAWVKAFRTEHELPPDALRRKLQALELLSRDEQRAWAEDAICRVERKLEAVEAHDVSIEGPFGRFAQESAREELRGRLAWLERLAASLGSQDD